MIDWTTQFTRPFPFRFRSRSGFSTCKYLGRKKHKNLGVFPCKKISQTTPLCKVTQRWWKSEMACIPFSSRLNCVHAVHWENHTLLLMWTCESFYCHTKLPSWSTWPLETHVQLDKKVVFFLKVVIWFRIWEVVNTGIEVEMSCSSSAVTTNQIHVLFYSPGLICSCCNWQVVTKKGLLTVLYFALCGLWDYFLKNTGMCCAMHAGWIYIRIWWLLLLHLHEFW